jgi:hypothetical protein
MKLNFTILIFIGVVCTFCFTSCKKDNFKTTPKNLNTVDSNRTAAIRFAVSFYKSVTGAYGGAELKNGIKISSVNPSAKRGPVLMSINPLCGVVIDTTADNTIINDTTRYHYGGIFSFTYTCSTDSPDGYINNNSFFTTTRTTNTLDTLHVIQQYNVKALDNTYKLVSLNGKMETQETKQIFNGPFYPYGPKFNINTDIIYDYAQYKLNDIKVDVSSGIPDMTAGTATFSDYHDIQNKNNTNIDYFNMIYATITFLGNHLARVEARVAIGFGAPPTNPTYVYTVNVLTGQIVN